MDISVQDLANKIRRLEEENASLSREKATLIQEKDKLRNELEIYKTTIAQFQQAQTLQAAQATQPAPTVSHNASAFK